MSKSERRKLVEERMALCSELPMMEDRLRRAGLLSTAIKMNTAVQEVGYEVALLAERERAKAP